MNKLIKEKSLPFKWCEGCSIRSVTKFISDYFTENGYNHENTSIISGIGCSGRIASYFNLDTMHTTHGRAVPVAEGLKLSNSHLNVFVISGEGDIVGIGLNHIINCARRNTNIKVICLNNYIYAMTGGQAGPTTKQGTVTATSSEGVSVMPINPYDIVCKPFNRPYARINVANKENFYEVLDAITSIEGFAFIEVIFPCFENDYRRRGGFTRALAFKSFNDNYTYVGNKKELKQNELGVIV